MRTLALQSHSYLYAIETKQRALPGTLRKGRWGAGVSLPCYNCLNGTPQGVCCGGDRGVSADSAVTQCF